MIVKNFMQLKNIVLSNRNRVKTLVNDTQHIPVPGNLLFIPIPGCGFFFDKLPDACICGNNPLNGI